MSQSRVVCKPVGSGTWESSRKQNKLLKSVLHGRKVVRKHPNVEDPTEDIQAAANIANLLDPSTEIDFDADDVPCWRKIIEKEEAKVPIEEEDTVDVNYSSIRAHQGSCEEDRVFVASNQDVYEKTLPQNTEYQNVVEDLADEEMKAAKAKGFRFVWFLVKRLLTSNVSPRLMSGEVKTWRRRSSRTILKLKMSSWKNLSDRPEKEKNNPTEAEVEDMKQNVNKIRKMDEEKGAQDSLEKELPGPEQMLSSPSPATNELKTSPLANYVSVSDRACAEAVAELKKAPPPKCYQEKDDDAIYHLNDDRLDFTRALGYHVPEECEGPIGRDWDSVDEGERSRFEMTGDCCETILLEGRHTMSDDEFYAADAHTQEYREADLEIEIVRRDKAQAAREKELLAVRGQFDKARITWESKERELEVLVRTRDRLVTSLKNEIELVAESWEVKYDKLLSLFDKLQKKYDELLGPGGLAEALRRARDLKEENVQLTRQTHELKEMIKKQKRQIRDLQLDIDMHMKETADLILQKEQGIAEMVGDYAKLQAQFRNEVEQKERITIELTEEKRAIVASFQAEKERMGHKRRVTVGCDFYTLYKPRTCACLFLIVHSFAHLQSFSCSSGQD
ncbi:Hypothetical protein (Fragment) [Durusdinium trenchii]|uniref:Uncharacterized protein n=1 Tax=Durusdinium trenchii TaxID=1381693 RepID=A0ABP0QC97_9DINO